MTKQTITPEQLVCQMYTHLLHAPPERVAEVARVMYGKEFKVVAGSKVLEYEK